MFIYMKTKIIVNNIYKFILSTYFKSYYLAHIYLEVLSIIIRIILFEEMGLLPVHAFNFYTKTHHITVCVVFRNCYKINI